MVQQTIGVIGSRGDLGSQLVQRLGDYRFDVTESDIRLPLSPPPHQLAAQVDILHICAPLTVLEANDIPTDSTVIVLHDSVMSSSKHANDLHLKGRASIVHVMMNSHETVIIDKEAPHFKTLKDHFEAMAYKVVAMSIQEHDRLMAESQAPLALLVEVIHQPLKKYRERGLLTPSGELLVQTLDARSIAWTPETIRSILRNPELSNLLDEMQSTIHELPPIK